MDRDKLTLLLAAVVGSVWAVCTLISLVSKDKTVLEAVTPVMLVVCGFLFGRRNGGK